MGFFVKNRLLKSGSVSVVVPAGDSAVRPTDPVPGQIRYNTDLCKLEYFTGAIFRVVAAEGRANLMVDAFVGDGVLTEYGPMVQSIDEPEHILVFVGSVYQAPNDAYTVDGSQTITFSSPVPNGVPINVIHNLGTTTTEGCTPFPPPPENVSQPENLYPGNNDEIDFS